MVSGERLRRLLLARWDLLTEAREALLRLDPLWDELFPAEQARIVQLLVERVEVGTDGLDLRLRVDGLTGLVREMATQLEQAA